uniref:Uncharacterized protein n=1 Tax=Spongospora subterranea TaxID=70186 RepID=A0A0H5R109_9EUKA|eukprot:CRZ01479.1 hypothetical protein [Spongospora subterranea]
MLVQSASKAVEDEYSDMTHNTNELLDFTDFSACRNLLKITAMATVDSMVWCLVNTLVLIVFTAMLIVWPLVEVGIKAFMLLVFKLGFCYDPPQTIRVCSLAHRNKSDLTAEKWYEGAIICRQRHVSEHA